MPASGPGLRPAAKTKAGEEGESLAGPPETELRARLYAQQWYPRNTTVAGTPDNHEDRRQPQYLACPQSGELELGGRHTPLLAGRRPAIGEPRFPYDPSGYRGLAALVSLSCTSQAQQIPQSSDGDQPQNR